MCFQNELIVESCSPTKWQLYHPLIYKCDGIKDGLTIIIPKGFTTDFASVPKIFCPILPHTGKYTKASALHDYLYSTYSDDVLCNRAEADKLFLQAMTYSGVAPWKRMLLYYAVRIFGALRYKPKQKLSLR